MPLLSRLFDFFVQRNRLHLEYFSKLTAFVAQKAAISRDFWDSMSTKGLSIADDFFFLRSSRCCHLGEPQWAHCLEIAGWQYL